MLLTWGGEETWLGKFNDLTWLKYAPCVVRAAEPPGEPARPVATISFHRGGRNSLDANTPGAG